MPRNEYTDEQRQRALDLYRQSGPSVAARETGIPAGTIRQWASKAGVTSVRAAQTAAATRAAAAQWARKREDLKANLLARIYDLLNRMDEPHEDFVGRDGDRVDLALPTAAAVHDYARSACMLLDRLRVEEGKASDITQHWTQTEFDREVEELVRRLREGDTEQVPVETA